MDRISSPSPLIACDEVEPGFSSGGVGFFCDALSDEESSHFLDSCFLCKKHLSGNRDIFMYRGDTPFCSEECRLQQIEMDECAEKWKRVRSTRQESGSPSKSEKIRVRFVAGTVVAS